MNKIKVGIVNYLNTKPLIYGIQRAAVVDQLLLIEDYPANIARMLVEGTIDVGLVPVAVIPHLKEHHIITDYCIGCESPVASVAIFSEVPLEKVEKVLLDYQSRTSVALAKVLLRKFWKIEPELIDTKEDYRSQIKGTTAGVVIGDRALQQRKVSPYIYDLGEAWIEMTGLPFVFAAWVSNKQLPADFIEGFNEGNKLGLQHIAQAVEENPYPVFDLHKYYTEHISYELTPNKRKGLEKFLEFLTAKQKV
ncbi:MULTISPECIES: menaquinone biosynthetic enzyme MqnA/MqnD family protein [Niastella]|uniref:Chorismate dehydratase n=1 Tax=Niastella soli TaxID=2821487 RepID=A0ABS3Z352_9BACT|nr:menaquinone biosynthesis protein [Niastella soli]MBO9204585.1 menaquinone biosynthesis protein [Niastella soli]